MSEEIERTLGKIESTMDHFGASLEEVKDLVRGSAESTGNLRIEVAEGLARVQAKQSAQETDTDRRFDVVDGRLDGTHRKVDGLRDAFSTHEKLESAGNAHGAGGQPGRVAVVGAGSAAGGVGLWVILQRALEFFVGSGTPPGGH